MELECGFETRVKEISGRMFVYGLDYRLVEVLFAILVSLALKEGFCLL